MIESLMLAVLGGMGIFVKESGGRLRVIEPAAAGEHLSDEYGKRRKQG